MFDKSLMDIAHLIECAVEIDLSVFSSSDPFVCNRWFEKATTNLRSLQEEIKEDFRKEQIERNGCVEIPLKRTGTLRALTCRSNLQQLYKCSNDLQRNH